MRYTKIYDPKASYPSFMETALGRNRRTEKVVTPLARPGSFRNPWQPEAKKANQLDQRI